MSDVAAPLRFQDLFRYVIGWTEDDDEDWDGLMWDGWATASLSEAKEHAASLAATNPGWTFVVYDNNENADDCLPYIVSASAEATRR